MLSSTYFNPQQMDVIKTCPECGISSRERKISSSILLDTVLYVFLIQMLENNTFSASSRADMKGKEECASTEPRFGLKECFPKDPGAHSQGSLSLLQDFAKRLCLQFNNSLTRRI